MTIKIVIVLILCIHYGYGEPPVNSYLPSSRNIASSFHKNYAPPAANVSFNFGFTPRSSKLNSLRDSTMLDNSYNSVKSQEPFYRNAEFLRNLVANENYNDVIAKKPVVSNTDVARDGQNSNNLMSLPTYTPDQVSNTFNQRSHATYGLPVENNDLPIIEDSLLRKTAQDKKTSHESHASDLHQAKSFERNSFMYGPPSQRSQIDENSERFPYEFSYDVLDQEAGVSLGHHENHDGSSAEGVYHSLLPDGRLLTVEYWADDGGFKPRLSYKTISTSKSANSGPY